MTSVPRDTRQNYFCLQKSSGSRAEPLSVGVVGGSETPYVFGSFDSKRTRRRHAVNLRFYVEIFYNEMGDHTWCVPPLRLSFRCIVGKGFIPSVKPSLCKGGGTIEDGGRIVVFLLQSLSLTAFDSSRCSREPYFVSKQKSTAYAML